MSDIKAEYIRLFGIELTNFGQELLNTVKQSETQSITDLVNKYSSKLYDISNADFEENFNPSHREEQPF